MRTAACQANNPDSQAATQSGNGALKVLTTYSDQVDKLASLLRSSAEEIDLQVIETAELDATNHDAELLLASYTSDEDRTLARTLLGNLKNLAVDIPVILLVVLPDRERVVEGLRIGAADVITLDDDQHLLQVIKRTRLARTERQERNFWQQRFAASERRCERLMDSSRDAIALISDGVYTYVNDAYALMLGHHNTEDLMLSPVIDSVHPDDHRELKPLMKPLSVTQPITSERKTFRMLGSDGTDFHIEMNVGQIDYQGEPTVQLIAYQKDLTIQPGFSGTTTTAENAEANPALVECRQVNLKRMTDYIHKAMREVVGTQRPWLLHYVRIDEFDSLQGDSGVHTAETAMFVAWQFLRTQLDPHVPLGRVRDNAFLFLTSNRTPADARQSAEALCRSLDGEVFDLGELSVNLHFSLGITAIDDDADQPTSWMDRCLKAVRTLDTEGSAGTSTRVRLFEDLYPTSLGSLNEENNIKQFVRQMLEQKMLGLVYQPIVSLQHQDFEDYEVFTRQTIAELPPGIPQDLFKRAFRTNVAGDLDRWAILESFKALKSRLVTHPKTRLFIKISSVSLRDTSFVPWFRISYQATGLDAKHLVFQIEEKDVSLAISSTRELSAQLNRLGLLLGVTHYGLSSSPGRIFSDLKFDFAKPDQSCVLRASTSTEGMEHLSACITAAKNAGVNVIVPFVEDAAIIPLLWKLGVNHIQGYYIQSPGPTMDYDFSSQE
jgi:PAS domain S-box-containing protein